MNAITNRRGLLFGALTAGAAATVAAVRPWRLHRHPTPSSHSWKPTKPHGRAASRYRGPDRRLRDA
jgi:hypothetical protein